MPVLLGYLPKKHLGIILDNQLKFDDHIKMVFRKISKTISLLRKLHNFLPRAVLITICKAFFRHHPDYGDILYDQVYNMSFQQKLESIQCTACLTITGAIRDTSKEKLYQEIGLESLQLRRWYRKLGMFYKIFKSKTPQYLFKLIPEKHRHMLQEMLKIFLFLISSTTFINILSFHRRSLNGPT